jgi:hypothetical protein
LKLWVNGSVKKAFFGHTSFVFDFCLDNKSEKIFSASDDRTVGVYHVSGNKPEQ